MFLIKLQQSNYYYAVFLILCYIKDFYRFRYYDIVVFTKPYLISIMRSILHCSTFYEPYLLCNFSYLTYLTNAEKLTD